MRNKAILYSLDVHKLKLHTYKGTVEALNDDQLRRRRESKKPINRFLKSDGSIRNCSISSGTVHNFGVWFYEEDADEMNARKLLTLSLEESNKDLVIRLARNMERICFLNSITD